MLERVSLQEKLATFQETWVPKVVAELNGQYVKVVKFEGEYVWHHHEHEDELFLVLGGSIDLEFRGSVASSAPGEENGPSLRSGPQSRDRVVHLEKGELCVVPRGVEHRPVAQGIAEVLLFEPAATRNTGNVDHDYTIEAADLKRV